MVTRGEIWWVDFGNPVGSEPAHRRPALVVSSDRFNRSRISTIIVTPLTSNLRQAEAPGNVALRQGDAGLPKSSVANVSQTLVVDRFRLDSLIGRMNPAHMHQIDDGLRLVLGL